MYFYIPFSHDIKKPYFWYKFLYIVLNFYVRIKRKKILKRFLNKEQTTYIFIDNYLKIVKSWKNIISFLKTSGRVLIDLNECVFSLIWTFYIRHFYHLNSKYVYKYAGIIWYIQVNNRFVKISKTSSWGFGIDFF